MSTASAENDKHVEEETEPRGRLDKVVEEAVRVEAVTRTATKGDKENLADVGDRFLAQLIDGGALALTIGFGLLWFAIDEPLGVLMMLLLVVSLVTVQWYLLTTEGQTIGKSLMKIRIVRYDTEENPGFGRAVGLREMIPALIGAIPLFGLLFALVDVLFIFGEERRCIHDYIAGTKVIDVVDVAEEDRLSAA